MIWERLKRVVGTVGLRGVIISRQVSLTLSVAKHHPTFQTDTICEDSSGPAPAFSESLYPR